MQPPAQTLPTQRATPFALGEDATYRRWREWKLINAPKSVEELLVAIGDPGRLQLRERCAIIDRCQRSNMAIFRVSGGMSNAREELRTFAARFGLTRLDTNPYAEDDGLSALRVGQGGSASDYIPYTNRPLNWHTDGYYNDAHRSVRAMLLYCECAAAEGGETLLLDHEMVYLMLRDANPGFIAALSAPDIMTIPANTGDAAVQRGAVSGSVFSVDPGTGALHMRYTARTRSIEWKGDAASRAALAALRELVCDDSPCVLRHRLEAGEGLLCNNVLHRRTGFVDDAAKGRQRLVYRARYLDRIDGTGIAEVPWR